MLKQPSLFGVVVPHDSSLESHSLSHLASIMSGTARSPPIDLISMNALEVLQVVPCLALHDTMRHIGSSVATVGFGGCMGMSGFMLAVGAKVRERH